MLTRREWLRSSLAGTAAALVAHRLAAAAPFPSTAPIAVTVYKTSTCGCCKAWVKHLESNGFKVTAHDLDQAKLTETKRTLNVPEALESCHTAVVGRYVFEGHVPADLITKFLNEKPNLIGLAVPGMPSGSPGMEGGSKQRYDVIAFERGGKSRVYASR